MQNQSGAERALFLPGASGVARFWHPVMQRLALSVETVAFDYPGFGGNPPDHRLASLADLTNWIETYIDRPVDILAQSMGGVIAMTLALRKHRLVRHLVLTGTLGGVRPDAINPFEWREEYRKIRVTQPDWLSDESIDITKRAANLPVPCLLVFGTQDPIAPLSTGESLLRLLPHARMTTIPTSTHFFVRDLPDHVAPHIKSFLVG